MEIIKRKINLEDFKSRIPSNKITCATNENVINSWGNIPHKLMFKHFDGVKYFSYPYVMDLYYKVLRLIMSSTFYESYNSEYDMSINITKEWRDYFFDYVNNININKTINDEDFISCLMGFPSDMFYSNNNKINDYNHINIDDKFYHWEEKIIKDEYGNDTTVAEYVMTTSNILCVVNDFNIDLLKDKIYKIIGSKNIFQFIYEVHNVIGKYISPIKINGKEVDGICVPLFFYDSDLDIKNENGLIYKMSKLKNAKDKISKNKYKEYGGDNFLDYLFSIPKNDDKDKQEDIALFGKTTINIPLLITSDLVDLGTFKVYNINGSEIGVEPNEEKLIRTTDNSKLYLLLSRKTEYNNSDIILKKSTKIKRDIYDTLKTYNELPIEYKEDYIIYNDELYNWIEEGEYTEIDYLILPHLFNILEVDSIPKNKCFMDNGQMYDYLFYNNKYYEWNFKKSKYFNITYETNCLKVNNVRNIKEIKTEKNETGFTYNITGDALIKITSGDTVNSSGFTYVVNGKFDTINNTSGEITSYKVCGKNPFTFTGNTLNQGDNIYGIWYHENHPLIRKDIFTINRYNEEEVEIAKVISYDIESDKVFSTENIVEHIDYPLFYDEKMLNLSYPLKEKYDVVIDRGSNAAFERHLQLTEVKTMQDLENYRNGSLLNK